MLDQNANETLERTEDGSMQHDRVLPIIILADILCAQPHRKIEVQLQGTALPYTAQTIAQGELDLGAIKSTLARLQVVRPTSTLQRRRQRRFSLIPELIGDDTLPGTCRQLGRAPVVTT